MNAEEFLSKKEAVDYLKRTEAGLEEEAIESLGEGGVISGYSRELERFIVADRGVFIATVGFLSSQFVLLEDAIIIHVPVGTTYSIRAQSDIKISIFNREVKP